MKTIKILIAITLLQIVGVMHAQNRVIQRPLVVFTPQDSIALGLSNEKEQLLNKVTAQQILADYSLNNDEKSVTLDGTFLEYKKDSIYDAVKSMFKPVTEGNNQYYVYQPPVNPVIDIYNPVNATVTNPNIQKPNPQLIQPALLSVMSVNTTKDVGEIPYQSGVANGALTYNIPIHVVNAGKGLQPGIALSYNSMSGNGLAGYGWGIGGLSSICITKSDFYFDGNAAGPEKKDTSSAYLLDGVRMIKTATTTTQITYETERGNITIISHAPSGKYYFEVFYPDGRKGVYGYATSTSAQTIYPLVRMTDFFSNYIQYNYQYSWQLHTVPLNLHIRADQILQKHI